MEKIERICSVCGKSFVPFGDYKGRKQKYCSRDCWSKRNPPEIKRCLYCGKTFATYARKQKYCSFECRDKGMVGRILSEETRTRMSEAKQGYIPVNIFREGEKHPFWIKDRDIVNFTETPEYKKFRIKILKRDDYSCQNCGRRGKIGDRPIFEIHHIQSRKDFPELSLVESNCITLCRKCHKKTDSYLKRWEDFTGKKAEKI